MLNRVEVYGYMLIEREGRKRWTEAEIKRKKKGMKETLFFIIEVKIV